MAQIGCLLYFAYGSNMSTGRLRERVPAAQPVGVAILNDYKFLCNKKSMDGSSKGNIAPLRDAVTWGVVFKIPQDSLATLDKVEGGYKRITVSVLVDGQEAFCETYISENFSGELPFDWYMKHIIDGAREHDIPDDYVRILSRIPVKTDDRANYKP